MASALVAVIAVTAVVAVSCDRNGGGGTNNASGLTGGKTGTSGAPSDVASANDTGPVGIITEDPSCAPWGPIISTLSGVEYNGWDKRDRSVPVASWTPEILAQYDAVATAMRKAADQTAALVKITTHRVMRELYGQFIAYSRLYASHIPNYVPLDDNLVQVATTAGDVVTHICDAISSGAAAARTSLASAGLPPSSVAPVGNLNEPRPMFDAPDAVCAELPTAIDQLLQNPVFKSWLGINAKIPVSSWPPEQQSLTNEVIPVMSSTADALEKIAQQTSNPVVQDLILLGVQYRRTFIQSLPTYQPNDQSIYLAGQYGPGVVLTACAYAAG